MHKSFIRVVLLGPPAAGKSTISHKMMDVYDITHISPGDILRWNVLKKTKLGKEAQSYMDQGLLVPNELVIKSVMERIANVSHRSWLLDGFPRTLYQAEVLDSRETIDLVGNIEVPEHIIMDRVKKRWMHLPSGRVYNVGYRDPKVPGKDDVTGEDLVKRTDDMPEAAIKRLHVYAGTIQPVLQFYEAKQLLCHYKGNTTAEIWPQLKANLEDIIQKKKCNI